MILMVIIIITRAQPPPSGADLSNNNKLINIITAHTILCITPEPISVAPGFLEEVGGVAHGLEAAAFISGCIIQLVIILLISYYGYNKQLLYVMLLTILVIRC